jgi:DNA gyrase subunit A
MPEVRSVSARDADDDQRRLALQRIGILDAMITVVGSRDRLFAIVGDASDAEAARVAVMREFNLDEAEATAVLDLQVRRFTAAERRRLTDERDQLSRECGLPN